MGSDNARLPSQTGVEPRKLRETHGGRGLKSGGDAGAQIKSSTPTYNFGNSPHCPKLSFNSFKKVSRAFHSPCLLHNFGQIVFTQPRDGLGGEVLSFRLRCFSSRK